MAHRKKKGKWLFAALALLAAAAVFFVLRPFGPASDDGWKAEYRVAAVESVTYQRSVQVSGNLEPLSARDLSFPVPGRVEEVAARQGAAVGDGGLIARLDTQAARFELAVVESDLELKRLSAPAREIRLLELERDLKARAVRDRELRSPLDGRVSFVDVVTGDYVPAGRRVARVVDVSSLKGKVQIDELDAPLVRVGLPVRFSFDALPDLVEVEGRVSAIASEGRVNSEGLAVLDGEVVIDRPPPRLLAGYSFKGEILLGEEEKVLVLPEAALVRERGKTYVYLAPVAGDPPERRALAARVLDSERIRVLSGLAEDEEVLVSLAVESGQRPSTRLSTKNLLQSMKERARRPFLGSGTPGPAAAVNGNGEEER